MRSHAESQVIVVTGASSGIGLGVALEVAGRGDHVVLLARDAGSLESAARACEVAGAASTLVLPTDVADDAAVAASFDRVRRELGRIDAVAHAAGVVAYGRVDELPAEIFDGVVRTNVLGSVNVSRHALRIMREQRRGALVLVGSVIGHIAVPLMTPYVVSKWGVRALARQLQLENRDQPDVHVSYVAPGGVLTPIYEQAANYAGWAGRPPPPVDPPEKVARVVVRRFDHPRHRSQVGPANHVIRFGFSAMPGVFDALVGPLFGLAAKDLTHPTGPVEGNVLAPVPERNALHGAQVGAVRGIARNVAVRVRARGARRSAA